MRDAEKRVPSPLLVAASVGPVLAVYELLYIVRCFNMMPRLDTQSEHINLLLH